MKLNLKVKNKDALRSIYDHVYITFAHTLDELMPCSSANSIDYQYNRHYKGYVKKRIEFIINTLYKQSSLEAIIFKSASSDDCEMEKISLIILAILGFILSFEIA